MQTTLLVYLAAAAGAGVVAAYPRLDRERKLRRTGLSQDPKSMPQMLTRSATLKPWFAPYGLAWRLYLQVGIASMKWGL
jgi:hypothetical protein